MCNALSQSTDSYYANAPQRRSSMLTVFVVQVDDSGKVQRLRKTCPAPECGPGVFMATHFNRVYWYAALPHECHLHYFVMACCAAICA